MYLFLVSGKLRNYCNNLRAYLTLLGQLTAIKVFVFSPDVYTPDSILKETVMCDISSTVACNNLTQREINTIYQWYNLSECFKLLDNIHIASDDAIVRIRPDINIMVEPTEFIEYLKRAVSFDGITIPSGNDIFDSCFTSEHTNTINDQIAIGKLIHMKNYCELFQIIDIKNHPLPIISEKLLYDHIVATNINTQRLPLNYTLCAKTCNVISITGDSGVGKTTLVNSLASIFPHHSTILETDRYHKWDRFSPKWLSTTHLNPSANYLEKMLDDTYLLRLGETIYQVDYCHNSGKFTEYQKISPKDIIFVCGLHTMSNVEQRDLVDTKIFIEVAPSLKQKWKVERDMTVRGYTYEKALELFQKRERDYVMFIQPQKTYADIIINYSCDISINCTIDIKKHYTSDVYSFLKENSHSATSNDTRNSYSIRDMTVEELLRQVPEEYKHTLDHGIKSSHLCVIQYLLYMIIMR